MAMTDIFGKLGIPYRGQMSSKEMKARAREARAQMVAKHIKLPKSRARIKPSILTRDWTPASASKALYQAEKVGTLHENNLTGFFKKQKKEGYDIKITPRGNFGDFKRGARKGRQELVGTAAKRRKLPRSPSRRKFA